MSYTQINKLLKEKIFQLISVRNGGNNNVYLDLKRHKEREDRIEYVNKEYEPQWSKMEVK